MRMSRTGFFLSIVLLGAITVAGCRQGKTVNSDHAVSGEDPNASVAPFLGTWRGPDKAAQQRTQLALSKWKNDVIDHEPILLTAILSKPWKARPPVITLVAFDEDKGLLGFGVVERYRDGTERSEEYPVYTHLPQLRVIDTRAITIHARDKEQEKDATRWEEYIRGERIDQLMLRRSANYYMDTLPPIYVSVPDPNKVSAFVYLYDRARNKSPLVELINHLGE